MKALNKLIEQWVELSSDGDEVKAKFKIKGLSGIDAFEFLGKVEFSSKGDLLINRDSIEFLLNKGLKGWENFKCEDEVIEFKQSNFERIPLKACKEIAMEIFALTEFGVEDKKK